MKYKKENELLLFEYIVNRGRVGLNELEENFAGITHETRKMSKESVYRAIERLEEKGKVKKFEIPNGKKKRVYIEFQPLEIKPKVKKFIELYKTKNSSNPSIEEIAIELEKTPQEVTPAIYAVAKQTGWAEPSKGSVALTSKNLPSNIFNSSLSEPLNKKEISRVIKMLKDNATEVVAAKYLHTLSNRQLLIEYPHILNILKKALKSSNDEVVNATLYTIYIILTSERYHDKKEQKEIIKEHKALLNYILIIANTTKHRSNKQLSIQILGMELDSRLIIILIESLKTVTDVNNYSDKGIFDAYIFIKFYQKYKMELLDKLVLLNKENPAGATILVELLNKRW